jgi:hypothetical protein
MSIGAQMLWVVMVFTGCDWFFLGVHNVLRTKSPKRAAALFGLAIAGVALATWALRNLGILR